MGKVYGYTAQIQAIEVGIKPKEMVDRSRTRNFRALPGIIVASNNISFFKLCQTELDFVVKNLVSGKLYNISYLFCGKNQINGYYGVHIPNTVSCVIFLI